MSNYKSKKKIFYFILPIKQNGYPDLTAWTDNEFLAQEYAKQYESLNPVILSCVGEYIYDTEVQSFMEENLGSILTDCEKLFTEDVTPFCDYSGLMVPERNVYLFTEEQQTAIFENWSYTQYEIYDMLCESLVNILKMSGFLLDDSFREIFGYIYSKYIIRLLISFSGYAIDDLPIESLNKLGLLKDRNFVCEDQIYNYSHLLMILIRKFCVILDGDK